MEFVYEGVCPLDYSLDMPRPEWGHEPTSFTDIDRNDLSVYGDLVSQGYSFATNCQVEASQRYIGKFQSEGFEVAEHPFAVDFMGREVSGNVALFKRPRESE